MAITGGTWKRSPSGYAAIVTDGDHPDPRINAPDHRGSYGGGLIAESIFNPDDVPLLLAAPDMLEALRACFVNGDPDDEFRPGDLTVRMVRAAIAKAEGKG